MQIRWDLELHTGEGGEGWVWWSEWSMIHWGKRVHKCFHSARMVVNALIWVTKYQFFTWDNPLGPPPSHVFPRRRRFSAIPLFCPSAVFMSVNNSVWMYIEWIEWIYLSSYKYIWRYRSNYFFFSIFYIAWILIVLYVSKCINRIALRNEKDVRKVPVRGARHQNKI